MFDFNGSVILIKFVYIVFSSDKFWNLPETSVLRTVLIFLYSDFSIESDI